MPWGARGVRHAEKQPIYVREPKHSPDFKLLEKLLPSLGEELIYPWENSDQDGAYRLFSLFEGTARDIRAPTLEARGRGVVAAR